MKSWTVLVTREEEIKLPTTLVSDSLEIYNIETKNSAVTLQKIWDLGEKKQGVKSNIIVPQINTKLSGQEKFAELSTRTEKPTVLLGWANQFQAPASFLSSRHHQATKTSNCSSKWEKIMCGSSYLIKSTSSPDLVWLSEWVWQHFTAFYSFYHPLICNHRSTHASHRCSYKRKQIM